MMVVALLELRGRHPGDGHCNDDLAILCNDHPVQSLGSSLHVEKLCRRTRHCGMTVGLSAEQRTKMHTHATVPLELREVEFTDG